MTKILALFDKKVKFWLNWGIIMYILDVYYLYYLAYVGDTLTNIQVTYAVVSNSILAVILIHLISSLKFWLCRR